MLEACAIFVALSHAAHTTAVRPSLVLENLPRTTATLQSKVQAFSAFAAVSDALFPTIIIGVMAEAGRIATKINIIVE